MHALFLSFGDAKAVPALRALPFGYMLLARLGFDALVWAAGLQGCLAAPAIRWPLNALACVAIAYGSVDPFRKNVNVYWAGALGAPFALLTAQPAAFFYGSGFVASLCQGVAHEQTGEKANLPELALRTGADKAGDEHAHTAFFPCLIVHSAYESLTHAGAPPDKRAA